MNNAKNDLEPCENCGEMTHREYICLCVICNSYVCEDCLDEDFSETWDEDVCSNCTHTNRAFLNIEHTCFRCENTINFFHAKKEYETENIDIRPLWLSPHIAFLCCDCFDECNSIDQLIAELNS